MLCDTNRERERERERGGSFGNQPMVIFNWKCTKTVKIVFPVSRRFFPTILMKSQGMPKKLPPQYAKFKTVRPLPETTPSWLFLVENMSTIPTI